MGLIDRSFWLDRRVLVTGHTGFKGSWLSLFLSQLGSNITGFSLDPDISLYSHFEAALSSSQRFHSIIGNILDKNALASCFSDFQPQVIFHLAAQPLVSIGYEEPVNTWNTNLVGTLNLLDSLSVLNQQCTVIIVTTDKVYKNFESSDPHAESDELGGFDPYSASKAAVELLVDSWRNSHTYLSSRQATFSHNISTVRSGNVIGGGDWSSNRIIPDLVKSLSADSVLSIRNPESVRPWQHVLDTLYGYILLAQSIHNNFDSQFYTFNFGPDPSSSQSVLSLVQRAFVTWPGVYQLTNNVGLHETSLLTLSSQKAADMLKWKPYLSFNRTVDLTIGWYKEYYHDRTSAYDLSLSNIHQYLSLLNA